MEAHIGHCNTSGGNRIMHFVVLPSVCVERESVCFDAPRMPSRVLRPALCDGEPRLERGVPGLQVSGGRGGVIPTEAFSHIESGERVPEVLPGSLTFRHPEGEASALEGAGEVDVSLLAIMSGLHLPQCVRMDPRLIVENVEQAEHSHVTFVQCVSA